MPQITIFLILLVTLVLFLWGRWRYDLVSILALLTVTLTGLIPPEEAFLGFSHPAVITVASVLILSQSLSNAGVINKLAGWLTWTGRHPSLQTLSLTGLTAVLSGFINDVGALGLFMPVAIRLVRAAGRLPSLILMPLAFSSILGGLMTAIGTPPNIYIASFRAEAIGRPFQLLDFFPVGVILVIVGVMYVSLAGWRLIPKRDNQISPNEFHGIKEYLTEVVIPQSSPAVGKRLEDMVTEVGQAVVILTIIRGTDQITVPSGQEVLQAGDVLILEADREALAKLIHTVGLELKGKGQVDQSFFASKAATLMDVVVLPESPIVDRTARELHLRWRYRINLLAISRQGQRLTDRLADTRIRSGDVLLLQGDAQGITQTAIELGCLPLTTAPLRLERPQWPQLTVSIFVLAVLVSALGLLTPAIAFSAAATILILVGSITLKEAYESINWPIIILLGAMIPVGRAFEATGAADTLGSLLVQASEHLPLTITVGILMGTTILLSNVINKSATTVLMAPVAVSVAHGLGGAPDAFLMAVAVGASAAFLTPIGHHCNTLVMGPGGYRFGDYWRMGLPLTILILLIATPLIVWLWPL